MGNRKYIIYLVVFVLLLNACSSLTPTATPLPTMVKPTPFSTKLPKATLEPVSEDWIMNSLITLPVLGKQVQLINGGYHGVIAGATNISVSVLKPTILGDLNGDNAVDAAVLLAEAGSASGIIVSLVTMINQDGKLVQSGSKIIDNQPIIQGMIVENGKIILTAAIHTTQDNECCPTLDVVQTYQWKNSNVILMRMAGKTPGGIERAINIDNPVADKTYSNLIEVKGSFTSAPDVNQIIYRIYDDQDIGITEGPVTVNFTNIGEAGTFETTVDLSRYQPGQIIRLAVVEIGSDDKLIKVMDSVFIEIGSP